MMGRSVMGNPEFIIDGDRVAYDFDRSGVSFVGSYGAEMVSCLISEEALCDAFGATGITPAELTDAFRASAYQIGEVVEAKLHSDRRESDGSVIVRSSDTR